MKCSQIITCISAEVFKTFIYVTVYMIILCYIVLWFHEGGHYLAASALGLTDITLIYTEYGFPTAIRIDMDQFRELSLNGLRYLIIVFSGIVTGMLPLICAYKYQGDFYKPLIIVSFVIYLLGCGSDVEKILMVLGVE